VAPAEMPPARIVPALAGDGTYPASESRGLLSVARHGWSSARPHDASRRDAREFVLTVILGRQRVTVGAGRPQVVRCCRSRVARAADCPGRSSVIGPSTAKMPPSWSVTIRKNGRGASSSGMRRILLCLLTFSSPRPAPTRSNCVRRRRPSRIGRGRMRNPAHSIARPTAPRP
jgi:hypothetical protein